MTRTTHEDRIDREEAAARLEELAEQLRTDDAAVTVGNKTVRLSPAGEVGYAVDVHEASSFLRGKRESVEIELEWRPGK